MKFKIQLVTEDPSTNLKSTKTLTCIEKNSCNLEEIGLSLKEAKNTLEALQTHLISGQIEKYLEEWDQCNCCGKSRRKKGHHKIVFRTLFGNNAINSPRYYHCKCEKSQAKTFSPLCKVFSELVSPERGYLETKWASKVSFQQAADLMNDILPLDNKVNASSIRNHLVKTGRRMQDDLKEEKHFYQKELNQSEETYQRFSVGIDGGYVRNWDSKKKHFEVIAGKSIPSQGKDRFFGFVDTLPDSKSKRNLFETLTSQGLNKISAIDFFSDGAENLRAIQYNISPESAHYLDWFHITMKITVLNQYVKGIKKIGEKIGNELERDLTKIKWYLWHGNLYQATSLLENFSETAEEVTSDYDHHKNFKKLTAEFETYINRNSRFITNYGERYRNKEMISTSFVESTVNVLVAKRFSKKQQMQWTKEGAHLMLQTRAKTLNNSLQDEFKKWYPKIELEYSKAA
ncbi:MAG: hypothetical protein ACI9J3_003969 [Parvicellaceae bacterium]|jgi:hypothetical protein